MVHCPHCHTPMSSELHNLNTTLWYCKTHKNIFIEKDGDTVVSYRLPFVKNHRTHWIDSCKFTNITRITNHMDDTIISFNQFIIYTDDYNNTGLRLLSLQGFS